MFLLLLGVVYCLVMMMEAEKQEQQDKQEKQDKKNSCHRFDVSSFLHLILCVVTFLSRVV